MFVGVSHLSSKAFKRITLAGCAYALLWLAVMLSEKLPESVLLKLPASLFGIIATVLGPPVLFVWDGARASTLVLVAVSIVAACLVISRFCWRRYPDSELFGVPLLAAVAVWIGSVWLAAALLGI